MSNYRRATSPGGTWFFTVVTGQRKPLFQHQENIELFKQALRHTKQERPFQLDALVILPDHLHCIWTLPESDSDYSNRWKMIKGFFSRKYRKTHPETDSVWQPRYWEHLIRDDRDYETHMDYIHFNPVKHGLVTSPGDWPYSTFQRCVERGLYPPSWGSGVEIEIPGIEFD